MYVCVIAFMHEVWLCLQCARNAYREYVCVCMHACRCGRPVMFSEQGREWLCLCVRACMSSLCNVCMCVCVHFRQGMYVRMYEHSRKGVYVCACAVKEKIVRGVCLFRYYNWSISSLRRDTSNPEQQTIK